MPDLPEMRDAARTVLVTLLTGIAAYVIMLVATIVLLALIVEPALARPAGR